MTAIHTASTTSHALLHPVADEGRPLDAAVRQEMERAFGVPFGDVVIHTGAASGLAAEELEAAAFTVGRHAVFGPGRYDPASLRGRTLLAHELAHVVEQRRGGGDLEAGRRLSASALTKHEQHAESAGRTAAPAALGQSAPVAASTSVGVARQPKRAEKQQPPTVPMFQYVDESGQTRLVSVEEGERLKAQALRRMRIAIENVESTAETGLQIHQEHLDMGHAESFGDLWDKPSRIFGVVSNMRAGVVPPTLGIWHHPARTAREARAALDNGDLREAARLTRLARTYLSSAQKEWSDFLDSTISGAETVVGELEVIRDTSFAIAIATGGIVAAPIVAGGVASLGATGAGATALTAVGTGVATMGGGAVLRGSSDVAAQKIVNGKVDWNQTKKYVGAHLKEDAASGIGGGLTKGLQAASVVARSSSVGGAVIRNIATQSAVTATTGVVTTAADTAVALAQGASWEEARDKHLAPGLEQAAVSTLSSAVSAPLGSVGQALGKGGRPVIGKAVEHVGGAVVAGGTTLASGGTWEDARASALNAAVTSTLLAQGQKGTEAADLRRSVNPTGQMGTKGATMPAVSTPRTAHETSPAATIGPHDGSDAPHAAAQKPAKPLKGGPKPSGAVSVTPNPATGPAPVKVPGEAEVAKPPAPAKGAPKGSDTGSGQGTKGTKKSRPARSGKAKARVKGTAAKPTQPPEAVEPGGPGDQTTAPAKKPTTGKMPGAAKPPTATTLGPGPRDQNGLPPGWNYDTSPTGPSRRWRIGDPVNMPDSKGRHPRWDTIRKRIWRTKAADELAKRSSGTSKGTDRLIPLDPVEELTPKQLEKVTKTGKMPARVGAEVEHARIPQRVGRMLEDVGVPRSKAAALTKLGDPTNLEPTHQEWHAVVDEKAHEINPNRNRSLPASLDDRAAHPLGSATNAEIAAIVDTINGLGVDLDTTAGLKLRRVLAAEKARRGASASWEVP